MRSQLYGFLMVLGLVLFQVGCCEFLPSSAVEGQAHVVLYNRDADYYGSPEQTINFGDAFRLETLYDNYLNMVVTVRFISINGTNLGDENPTSYGGLSFSVAPPEGVRVETSGDSPLGSQEIMIYGKVSLLQEYMTHLQYTFRSDIEQGTADAVRGMLRYGGAYGNAAILQVHYNDEPTPTPIPPTAVPVVNTPSAPAVNPSNVAPVNTVPSTQGITYGQSHVMNFLVQDPDIGNNAMTVTLQVDKGTLTVNPANGANVSGNGTNSITITGTLDAVNNTLLGADGVSLGDGVTYLYTGDNLSEGGFTTDSLSFSSRDNWGASATDTVRLEISYPMQSIYVPPVDCVEIDTVYYLYDFMFGLSDLNFDLSAGVNDANPALPLSFSVSGLPSGFSVNGNYLQANAVDVDTFALNNSELIVNVTVTDTNGCTGGYELTLQYD